MRILDSAAVPYEFLFFDTDGGTSGMDVARTLGIDPDRLFKTLVTQAKSKNYYVFMVPVDASLDLKKAAKAVDEKAVEMIPQKELYPLTGYVHGGCSPLGMKKAFPTVIDETALLFDEIAFSGGKIGCQIRMNPEDLCEVLGAEFIDIT